MATEKIEDTDNLTSYDTCRFMQPGVQVLNSKNVSLLSWEFREEKKTYNMTVANLLWVSGFALNLYFLQLFCTHSAAALDRYVLMLLTIHVFFYPSLWGKLCPQCLRDCLYLLLFGNMGKIARFQSLSVSSSHLAFFTNVHSSFVIHVTILSYATHFLIKKWNCVLICKSHFDLAYCQIPAQNLFDLCRTWKI